MAAVVPTTDHRTIAALAVAAEAVAALAVAAEAVAAITAIRQTTAATERDRLSQWSQPTAKPR